MAIDLGTSLSPYEFQNMLPLDVLAAVASQTLKNEIHSNDIPGRKTTFYLKKQLKKSTQTVMTFEEMRALPLKLLVDKFSEMTSDELTKKYSYKCLLIPQKCTMTFKSFGNEKKACDKIKSHLVTHIQQLAAEFASNTEISNTFFVPKSPTSISKHAEKFSKKSPKKQNIYLPQGLARKSNSYKSSKKVKNSAYCVKKIKKFQNLDKKSIAELKKCFTDKKKLINSIYFNGISGIKQELIYESRSENNSSPVKVKTEISDETDVDCDNEKYNSYSKHLKNTFFSEAFPKDYDEHESFDNCEEKPCLNDDNNVIEGCSEQTSVAAQDESLIFLQDHDYAISDETKSDKLLSHEFKDFQCRNTSCFSNQPIVQPQLIIRTPPFPFVHTPLLPEVAEIKEIGFEEIWHSDKQNHIDYINCLCDESKVQHEFEEMQDEHTSEQEEKFATSIFYKINGASGSVLECVENIVSSKYSNSCVPKSEIAANENDENLENLQRIEKELALKYIAKLHAKKKKRIPDSLICQICPDKHFTAQATLIHHYRSHAGIKPYVCKICSATFTRQHSLNYHMLIHQNLSRFTCEFCGRTFRHPSHYKEHLRRHTGETPYHCTDCNLHFKTRNTFKRHLKTRHGKLLTASGIEDLSVEEYAKFNPKTKLGKQ